MRSRIQQEDRRPFPIYPTHSTAKIYRTDRRRVRSCSFPSPCFRQIAGEPLDPLIASDSGMLKGCALSSLEVGVEWMNERIHAIFAHASFVQLSVDDKSSSICWATPSYWTVHHVFLKYPKYIRHVQASQICQTRKESNPVSSTPLGPSFATFYGIFARSTLVNMVSC